MLVLLRWLSSQESAAIPVRIQDGQTTSITIPAN